MTVVVTCTCSDSHHRGHALVHQLRAGKEHPEKGCEPMETIELLLWKSVKISIHDHEKQICLELVTGCSTFSCLSLYMQEIFSFIEGKKKKNLFTSWAHQWQVTPVPKLSIPSEACVWGRGAYQLSQKLGRRPSKLVQGLPIAPEDPQSPLNHSLPRPQRQETQQDWLCYKILKLPYLIAILKACRTWFRGGSYIWDYQSSKEAACSQQSLTRDRDH